ncbi:MAG: hypothetical protein EB127_02155 [Alphaproteobacteria bacterium]|nr:hypothetical protein [Alphaproteobacteria bacterium]
MNLSWFSTDSFASANDLLNTSTSLSTNYTGNLIAYQDIWISNNGNESGTGNLIDFGLYVAGLDINSYNELLKLGSQEDLNGIYCGLYIIFGYTDSAGNESWIDKFDNSVTNGIYTFLNRETNTGSGAGATFDFTLPLGGASTYTNSMITINNPGAGYQVGDICRVSGALLGGSDYFTDAIIQVTGIGGNAEITSFTSSGTFENPSLTMNLDYSKFRVNWDSGINILNKINIKSTYTYNGSSYVTRNNFPINEGATNAKSETQGRLKVRFLIKSPSSGNTILSNVTLNAAALGEL